MGRGVRLGALALACVMMTGCRHKVKAVVPQPATAPVPIEKAPEPANPPVIAQVPLTPAPLPAVKVPEKKVKKPRKKVVPAAPVEVASAAPAPAPGAAIGALTMGGDEKPGRKQQAAGMLSDLEKRLAGLAPGVLEGQKEGIARVRYFEKEAKAALDSGDVEGAVTLLTKAKVLLDDLVK
jgi:outer membrane biosynthesis protein TonB